MEVNRTQLSFSVNLLLTYMLYIKKLHDSFPSRLLTRAVMQDRQRKQQHNSDCSLC